MTAEKLEKIIKFLSGKKSTIASIIWLLTWYMATKGWIWETEVVFMWWLSIVFFWSASYLTGVYYKNKTLDLELNEWE